MSSQTRQGGSHPPAHHSGHRADAKKVDEKNGQKKDSVAELANRQVTHGAASRTDRKLTSLPAF